MVAAFTPFRLPISTACEIVSELSQADQHVATGEWQVRTLQAERERGNEKEVGREEGRKRVGGWGLDVVAHPVSEDGRDHHARPFLL